MKSLHKTLLSTFMFVFTMFLISPIIGLNSVPRAKTPEPHLTTTPTIIPARDLDLLPTFESLVMSVNEENCTLPCWWNLEPGETKINEVADFLRKTGFDRQLEASIYSSLPLEDYLRLEQFVLYFQDNSYFGEFIISFGFDDIDTLTGIRLVFNDPNRWLNPELGAVLFPKIVSQIEEMPEIYINEYRSTFTLGNYTLIALFQNTGVEISYHFDLSDDNPHGGAEGIRLCLNLERTKRIEISLSAETSEEKVFDDSWVTPENAYGIGISTEEFVQFFRENPDECLDIAEYQRESE